MFNSTKAHEKWINDNQYKIRMGNRVPKGAVSLAYSYVTPLNPKENVQIADLSGFVLENIASGKEMNVQMWPNDAFLLQSESGSTIVPAKNLLMTNVFKGEKPLYYMYETKYKIIDSDGPDANGIYQGNSISLIDRVGQRVSDIYSYKILLIPTGEINVYKVRIFTDFQTQPSDIISVIYTALIDGSVTPGHTELISPQPAFERRFTIQEVVSGNAYSNVFYQSNGMELSESQVIVSQVPMKNSDYRHPVKFDYTVTVSYIDGTTYTTPSISDNVYNEHSVTEADEFYYNGFKRLQGITAQQIVEQYHAITKEVSSFVVSTANLNVELYTQPDGQNYILASTQTDTGFITLPPAYRIEKRDGDIYYAPTYSIKLTDSSQIKVINPIETGISESWFTRINNGKFYKEGTNSAGFPVKYQYSVPEYYTQNFDSKLGLPYKAIVQERPVIVGEHKIKVRHTPLYVRDNVTVTVNGIQAKVKAWNTVEGTFEIDMKIKETDKIAVDYFYEEHTFTYRGYWDEKNQKFWVLDLNPSSGHMYTDMDKETGDIVDVPSFRLINKTVFIYIKPSAVFSENGMMVRGSYNPKTVFHTFDEINDSTVVLLAKIRVRPNSAMDNIKLVDTRKRGGGLISSITDKVIKEVNPDSQYNWDVGYWDGEPYSENGVGIVRIPRYVLKENGGRFTSAEVQQIVKRHFGYGNLPIIEYIDEPVRLLGAPINTTLDIVKVEE